MEFRLVGQLDAEGRVVSVQSSCQSLGSQLNPGVPGMANPGVQGIISPISPDKQAGIVEEGKDDNAELLYKLDSKTNEMSKLILQVHQLMGENEQQKKKIEKYESDLQVKETEIRRLISVNTQLKQALDAKENVSDTNGSMTQPKRASFQMTYSVTCTSGTEVKYLSWPTSGQETTMCANMPVTEQNNHGVKSNKPDILHSCQDKSHDLVDDSPQLRREEQKWLEAKHAERSGDTDSSYVATSGPRDYVDSKQPIELSSEILQVGQNGLENKSIDITEADISSPEINSQGKCSAKQCQFESSSIKNSPTEASVMDSNHPRRDENGYLLLEPGYRCGEEEQIHVTLTSIKRPQGALSGRSKSDDLSDCRTSDVNDVTQRFNFNFTVSACSPPPAVHGSNTDVFSEDTRYCRIPDDLVADESPGRQPSAVPQKPKADRIYSLPVKRHSSPDLSKSDKGMVNLVRLMKTTMEWQKAKKDLMRRSTSCTCDMAERFLKEVLQECIFALSIKSDEKRNTSASLERERIKTVKKEIKNKPGSECIKSEFLVKCLSICSGQLPC